MIPYTHVLYLGIALLLGGAVCVVSKRVQRSFSTWTMGMGAATVALAMARLWGDANGLMLASVVVLGTAGLVLMERNAEGITG